MVFVVVSNPDMPGYDLVVGYNERSGEQALNEGIMETTKIRTYQILFDYWLTGKFSPLIGVGPGNYLSGASLFEGSEYTRLIIGNTALFKSGLFSNMLSGPQNDFVGLSGEIGIPGYIVMLIIYIFPLTLAFKNKYYFFKNSFWATLYAGFFGIFWCVIGWSFVWNMFEEWAMPVYYFIIGGILLAVKFNHLIEEDDLETS